MENPNINAQAAVTEAQYWATWGAARDGARTVLTRRQAALLIVIVASSIVLVAVSLHTLVVTLLALSTTVYFLTGIYKLALLVRGEHALSRIAIASQPAEGDDLPMYTILVPLHREGKMLPVLIERLVAIDYPPDCLEVLLLIESDDGETRNVLRRCALPFFIRPVIVPAGRPRTKPRALNVGLAQARGEHLVIYDAEDHPEPSQLRKAVTAFRQAPPEVACLQARLNFYNRKQTLLTRLFAVDYASWYDQLLPGLARTGAFVPLGGTSNHFRIAALRKMGGWDPFNVTEDCDLGARLSRAGIQISMLDSVTMEEAVPHAWPWIRQRSRWIKGFLQTYLVHMRHPFRLWRQFGSVGFIDFQLLVGGTCVVLLINPFMWALTVAYIAGAGTQVDAFIESLFPAWLYYPSLLCLVAGNFVFFYINAYVCVRHDYINLTRYALLTPLYWVLMSIGAWAGLFSFLRHPHYWAKTDHGSSLRARELVFTTRSDAPMQHAESRHSAIDSASSSAAVAGDGDVSSGSARTAAHRERERGLAWRSLMGREPNTPPGRRALTPIIDRGVTPLANTPSSSRRWTWRQITDALHITTAAEPDSRRIDGQ
ncbi:MAG TPA: glycosyltransferase [Ktedonobacterales bacterium]|nr:glycosyltransferase [Ktedonobacterales bacterium]